MKEYKITLNGKEETWYLSEKEMTHADAMAFIEKAGKRAPELAELLQKDVSGKTRLRLLHGAGANGCAWCRSSLFDDYNLAFNVNLFGGNVYTDVRNAYYFAICRD